jgi:hypothetical protein
MLKDTTDTGMSIDPNGKPVPTGSGMLVDPSGLKTGMSIDPDGTPAPNGSNAGSGNTATDPNG